MPSLFQARDTLNAGGQALVQRADFTRLWLDTDHLRETPVLAGFFGPDHYRFELVLTEAVRQPQHPDQYRVQGKCHYRQNVRPFAGWLTIRQLVPLPILDTLNLGFIPHLATDTVPARTYQTKLRRILTELPLYQVRADLQVVEQPAPNSGELRGEVQLNCYLTPQGHLGYVLAQMRPHQDGATVLLRGSRLNVTTHQVKPFAVSDNVYMLAGDI